LNACKRKQERSTMCNRKSLLYCGSCLLHLLLRISLPPSKQLQMPRPSCKSLLSATGKLCAQFLFFLSASAPSYPAPYTSSEEHTLIAFCVCAFLAFGANDRSPFLMTPAFLGAYNVSNWGGGVGEGKRRTGRSRTYRTTFVFPDFAVGLDFRGAWGIFVVVRRGGARRAEVRG